jgi:hypothetical protein
MTEPLDAVRALVDEMEQDARRVDPQEARHQAAFDEAARDGSFGPQWRGLQRRIDGGRTTLVDVFGGTDTSPQAAAVQAAARSGLSEVRAAAAQVVMDQRAQAAPSTDPAAGSPDAPVENPFDAPARAGADLRARVEALRRALDER